MNMKKNLLIIVLAVGTLTFSSCASKKDLENCRAENNQLTADYQNAKEIIAANNARIKSLEDQLAQARESAAALQGSLDNSLRNANSNNINISKLVDQINESNQYIRHLVEVKSKSDSLNMVLTNNLTRSLSREELKEVDVQVLKGVVYISLADNMLYKSGSYEINDRAEQTLSKIAKIITDYKDYDVLIEGNPKRLTAGGRGEYNPLATNDTELGKQRNRRTQIIITPKLDQFMDLIGKAPDSNQTK